jgi:hypothetical protein
MGMMQMPTDQIVKVVPVGHAFVSTGRTVGVAVIVSFAVMIRCAGTRIELTHRDGMFVDMVVMDMMHVSIVEVIGVALVGYG